METEQLDNINKIIKKGQFTEKGNFAKAALKDIEIAYKELVSCKPFIKRRKKRVTQNGKKYADKFELEYDLSTYRKNIEKLIIKFSEVEPFIIFDCDCDCDFTIEIPREPKYVIEELTTNLKVLGYTNQDIKDIVKIVNFYDINQSWNNAQKKENKEKREKIINFYRDRNKNPAKAKIPKK